MSRRQWMLAGMTRMKSTNIGKEPVAILNTWKRAVAALQLGFPGLVLFLALACSSVSSPATSMPPVSTGTPVVEGTIQTPRQATEEAAPAQGSSQEAVATPATVSAPTETSEPTLRSNGADGDNQAPSIPYKGGLKYPNLGSRLDGLLASVETGQITAEEAAADSPVHSGESVAVTIYLSGSVDGVVSFLENNGVSPRNVGEDYLEAYVPVTLLGLVSERPGVIRVREILPPEPGRSG